MFRALGRRFARGPAHGEPARVACGLVVLCVCLVIPGGLAAQSTMSVPDFYREIGAAWGQNARPYVIGLFSALFVVDVAVIYLDSVDDRGGPEVTFMAIVRRLVVGGVGLTLFLNPEYFSLPLIRAFESAGTAIGGAGVAGLPDPLVVLMQGWDAFSRLVNAIFIPPEFSQQSSGPGGDLTGVLEILRSIAIWSWYIVSLGSYLLGVGLVALVLLVGFGVMALQVVMVKAQSFLLVNIGLLFVGAVGSRLVSGLHGGYVRFVIKSGVRLFLMGAMFGVYYQSLPYWERWIAQGLAAIPRGPGDPANVTLSAVSFEPLLMVAMTVTVTSYLVWKIPGWFSDFVMQEVHFSLARGKQ